MGRNTIHKTAKVKPKAASARKPAGASSRLQAQGPKTRLPRPRLPSQSPGPTPRSRRRSARLRAANPEPRGELEHINPYTLLVAVVLSAQATDAGVNKATRALFAQVDTPEKMVALGEAKLRDAIKTIGLFNTKAKNVIALSHKLIAEHGGEVPRERAVLETLPGVGRKTANVVLNVAFGEETFAVDTHVFRVGNRTGMAPGKTPLEVELEAGRGGAAGLPPARPSLADPARPLHLQGPAPAVREMPDQRSVPLAGKDHVHGDAHRALDQFALPTGEALVEVHHERGAEQRRGEVEDRYRHEAGDEQAADEHRGLVDPPQRLGFRPPNGIAWRRARNIAAPEPRRWRERTAPRRRPRTTGTAWRRDRSRPPAARS